MGELDLYFTFFWVNRQMVHCTSLGSEPSSGCRGIIWGISRVYESIMTALGALERGVVAVPYDPRVM